MKRSKSKELGFIHNIPLKLLCWPRCHFLSSSHRWVSYLHPLLSTNLPIEQLAVIWIPSLCIRKKDLTILLRMDFWWFVLIVLIVADPMFQSSRETNHPLFSANLKKVVYHNHCSSLSSIYFSSNWHRATARFIRGSLLITILRELFLHLYILRETPRPCSLVVLRRSWRCFCCSWRHEPSSQLLPENRQEISHINP